MFHVFVSPTNNLQLPFVNLLWYFIFSFVHVVANVTIGDFRLDYEYDFSNCWRWMEYKIVIIVNN